MKSSKSKRSNVGSRKLVIHPSFEPTIAEMRAKKIALPVEGLPTELNFSSYDIPQDGASLYSSLKKPVESSDVFHQAVRFFVMNRITYSGTIDSGGYSAEAFEKRFTASSISKLGPLPNLLREVEIVNESYEKLLFEPGDNVFIFLDPPYWKSRKSKLYGKSGDLHFFFDHKQFSEDVKKCRHNWLMTCDDSDIMRELFRFGWISPWEWSYGMTNVNGKKASMEKSFL